MNIDVRNVIYITPMAYDVTEVPAEPDYILHSGQAEADILAGSDCFFSVKDLPPAFKAGAANSGGIMHFETIKSPDGKRYFPLFDSYNAVIGIFGKNIQLSMTCFDTALKMCREEHLDGIVLCPGTPRQQIIAADRL